MSKKLIAVFGATGHQGGAVARALGRDSNFEVRGITRDVQQKKIEDLKANGVTVLQCDLDDVNNIAMAVRGTDGVFVVTYTDFCEKNCIENEKQRGRNIIDACVQEGVPQVIYSTQLHTTRVIGIEARHLVAKAEIEDYMNEKRSNKMSITSIMVPCYYENLYDYLKPRRLDNKQFVLEIPMGTSSLDLVSVEDIGHVVKEVFLNPCQHHGKTLSLSGSKLTIKEMAAELTRYLHPLTFKDRPVTIEEYRKFGQPWSVDFANMFNFFLRADQRYNLEKSKLLNPNLQSFRCWVERNACNLRAEFDQL